MRALRAAGRDREGQDVRPVVVPRGIEALALLVEQARLEDRRQDPLLVAQRPREVGARRREDRAAAASDDVAGDLVQQREVVGVAGLALERSRADHERARLARYVDERRLPRVAVVRGRGEVDLEPGLVEGEARERHVVLPADEAADAAHGRLDRTQAAAVASAPDEALV